VLSARGRTPCMHTPIVTGSHQAALLGIKGCSREPCIVMRTVKQSDTLTSQGVPEEDGSSLVTRDDLLWFCKGRECNVQATIWCSKRKQVAWEHTTLKSALKSAATSGSACAASSVLPDDDLAQASGRRPAVISLWQLAS
jgi:hypothetical protein